MNQRVNASIKFVNSNVLFHNSNPVCWTCKNCSYECAADCEHYVTQPSTEQFW